MERRALATTRHLGQQKKRPMSLKRAPRSGPLEGKGDGRVPGTSLGNAPGRTMVEGTSEQGEAADIRNAGKKKGAEGDVAALSMGRRSRGWGGTKGAKRRGAVLDSSGDTDLTANEQNERSEKDPVQEQSMPCKVYMYGSGLLLYRRLQTARRKIASTLREEEDTLGDFAAYRPDDNRSAPT